MRHIKYHKKAILICGIIGILLFCVAARSEEIARVIAGTSGEADDIGQRISRENIIDETIEDIHPYIYEEDFSRISGTWYLDGQYNALRIEISDDGKFTIFEYDGDIRAQGYMEHSVEEYDDGLYVCWFDFYTDDGKLYMSFVDDESENPTEFYTASETGERYVRPDKIKISTDE